MPKRTPNRTLLLGRLGSEVARAKNGITSRIFVCVAAALLFVLFISSNRAFADRVILGLPVLDWDTNLTRFRVDSDPFIGQRFLFRCPERTVRDKDATLSGTRRYASDSAICAAAVHAGVVTIAGGVVAIQLEPGARSYLGSERYGVVSADFPQTPRSFRFVDSHHPDPLDPIQSAWVPRLRWDTKFTRTGLANRDLVGQRFGFVCPAATGNLQAIRVAGTDSYAFDSYVCQAAVHAGRITHAGGFVVVEINESCARLRGSIRHGIETRGGSSGSRALTFPVLTEHLPIE